MSAVTANIWRMERQKQQPKQLSYAAAAEADAVRMARLRRDRALTPVERLDKLAALCRQADLLRGARRLP
jgi:hypothetical protein